VFTFAASVKQIKLNIAPWEKDILIFDLNSWYNATVLLLS